MEPDTVSNRSAAIAVLVIATVIGFCCFCGLVVLSGETIIATHILLLLFTASTIVGLLAIKYNPVLRTAISIYKRKFINSLAFAVFAFGCTCTCAFLYLNKCFAHQKDYRIDAPITDKVITRQKGYKSNGERKNNAYTISFTIMGQTERTEFDEVFHKEMEAADAVEVTYRKGLFGYYVMTGYKLK